MPDDADVYAEVVVGAPAGFEPATPTLASDVCQRLSAAGVIPGDLHSLRKQTIAVSDDPPVFVSDSAG